MRNRIHLSPPHLGGDEIELVSEAFESNWIAPLGPHVNALEQETAAYVGATGAVALSSGTAAIHLALKCAGVTHGDYVFCSSLTFAGTCNPILYEKARPVFIDAEPESWNMSPTALQRAFETFAQRGFIPRAVIIVDLYGQSADMDKLLALCNQYGVMVIEDAAEALGARYKGKANGTFGQIGTFSFNGNKIITTSGGGMAVSDDRDLLERIRFWATQAREPVLHYEHREIGYNYRMSNVCAAIGRGQMRVLDKRLQRKKRIFEIYKHSLAAVPGLHFMPIASYGEPNYWLTVVTIDEQAPTQPCDLIARLEAHNIEARPIWKPMHLQPVFSGCEYFPHNEDVSAGLFRKGVCLPSGTAMTDDELTYVIAVINESFSE